MPDTSVPFEWWLFILATCLNLLIHATRVVGISIDFAVGLSTVESALHNQSAVVPRQSHAGSQGAESQTSAPAPAATPSTAAQESSSAGGTMAEAGKAAALRENNARTEKPVFGAVVGFIERQLYLYALFAKTPDIIAAVLLFKAFSGWIAGDAPQKAEGRNLGVLAGFYVYAIGNFVSLLWALLIFQFCLLAVQYSKPARDLLCIGCG